MRAFVVQGGRDTARQTLSVLDRYTRLSSMLGKPKERGGLAAPLHSTRLSSNRDYFAISSMLSFPNSELPIRVKKKYSVW